MATIKNFLGFAGSSSQKPSVDNTGVVLQYYSGVEDNTIFSIVNNGALKPARAVDWVITNKYVLLSFALSRDWREKFGSSFEKPKVHLAIQGKDYIGNNILKKIYTDEGMGNNVDCKWDGYYGIIRVSFLCSQLKDFNRISYIGIIIARDNSTNGSDSMSKIFKIGQDETLTLSDNFKDVLVASDKLDGFNKNEIKTETIKVFSRITRYDTNPVSSSTSFNDGKIFVSPISLSGQLYTLSGSNSKNSSYTHNKYYYNQAIITFQTKSFSGVTSYPSYCSINNGEFEKIEGETLIKGISNIADYQPEIILVYGGYQYKMGTNISRPKLRYYLNFLSPTEEEFLQSFSFEGERYRTKFVNYASPNSIKLQTVISGILKNKNPQQTPYRINEATVEYTTTLDNKSEKPLSRYKISFSNISNNFTNGEEESVEFYLPLIDEYKYYNLGEVALLKSDTQGINFSCYNRENIVKHYDLNLIDKFTTEESANVFDITTWTNRAVLKSWEVQNSDVPLDSMNFRVEGVMESDISEGSKSYFSYCRPVIKLSKQEDITSITKMPIEKQFYTVLYCQRFLKDDPDLGLKIKNGTLFYKFPEGSFDCNATFKDNDFINYAISENRSIGLSDQERNEHFTLTISNNNETYSIEISTSGIKINGNNTDINSLFFHELLTNFYCGTERILQLPYFSTTSSEVNISFKYEKSYAGTNYIIFEKTINNVPVASGDRPLGLRKGGIIVNPLEQNEQLPQGIAEQINLKTKIVESNKLVGKGINILVCDPNGNPLDETVAIEYKADYDTQTQKVSNGAFYFDGVNVSELKNVVNNSETGLVKKVGDLETTVGDSDSGLVKDVNQNTSNISSLLGLECFVLDAFAKEDNGNVKYFSDGDSYTGSIIFSNDKITANSICIPFLSVVQRTVEEGENSNHIKLLRENLRLFSTGLSQAAGSASLEYAIYIPNEALYNYNIRLKGRLLVINLPSVLTSSINLDSLSMDDEEMINTTLSNEVIQTIIEDEENLTTP